MAKREGKAEAMSRRTYPDEAYRVEPHDRGTFLVHHPEGHTYLVDLEEWTCTCDAFFMRGSPCRHRRIVAERVNPSPTRLPSLAQPFLGHDAEPRG
jgi:hypothetical protein